MKKILFLAIAAIAVSAFADRPKYVFLFIGDGRFDLFEFRSVHLRHLRQHLDAVVAQEFHDEVALDSVFLSPIDRFNLFFNTH